MDTHRRQTNKLSTLIKEECVINKKKTKLKNTLTKLDKFNKHQQKKVHFSDITCSTKKNLDNPIVLNNYD